MVDYMEEDLSACVCCMLDIAVLFSDLSNLMSTMSPLQMMVKTKPMRPNWIFFFNKPLSLPFCY